MTEPPAVPRYAEFAAAILDTPIGELVDVLSERFAEITRFEVFLGCAFAKALWEADAVLALGEIRALEMRLQQQRAAA